jgi:hypothetical protein
MVKKDNILKSYLEHEVLLEKYGISTDELPNTVDKAQISNEAIIKTIAIIIDSKEVQLSTDKELYRRINQYLNEAAI